MFIFEWRGPETNLGQNSAVATEFIIGKVKDLTRMRKYAEGTIMVKDYIEHGIEFSDRWEANGVSDEKGHFCWLVSRIEDKNSCFFDKSTGETHFTLSPSINRAIKKFIAEMLNRYLDGKIEPEPQKYTGQKEMYKGPCVCKELAASNKEVPFLWEKMTNGGKFPEHCFACSCSENWWCYNPEKSLWARIKDKRAWEMLTLYNGVAVRKLGVLRGAFYLLQTLRDEGFIPIPD